jgi:D-alanyl-D-alanine carboxypeptidase (penicillin-binding protein 5/6)
MTETNSTKAQKKSIDWFYYLGLIALAIIIYIYLAATTSLNSITPNQRTIAFQTESKQPQLSWPNYGAAAIGINNQGVTLTKGSIQQFPMASTAKLLTALVVLKKYPLQLNQSGPIITINQSDVAIYNNYLAEEGSVTPVVNGEKISEYQILQAMLLPSADNMADTLAIWAYGSLNNYLSAANAYLLEHGLTEISLGSDASGYNPNSKSTASDLVLLGELAMKNPVISQIASLKEVTNYPVAGTIKNINFILGQDGINGLKTGNNNQDGGIFIASAKVNLKNKQLPVITAVMGAPSLWYALNSSLNLVKSIDQNFVIPNSISSLFSGTKSIANYNIGWDHQVLKTNLANQTIPPTWTGGSSKVTVNLNNITFKTKAGSVVGSLKINSTIPSQTTTYNIYLSSKPKKPPLWWLLLHPKLVL